ncbi:3-deoxy-manno-octulosonate cytidylyltransferase [Candidatus Babeliales bacterium]|nr:3-deoxy-manno-octulosonate cytidylyltransferase [Candidatus Babeliales bacterium]
MFNKKITCIIPARLNSIRFPKKILSSILGKPILQWVFDAASKIKKFDSVLFAIDSEETKKVLKSFNAPYVMTSQNCPSGTHRLIEVMKTKIIDSDIWVNWQADEPFISEKMINDLLKSSKKSKTDVWTLKKEIINKQEIISPNTVKVVSDFNDKALYFSRSPIPYYREKIEQEKYFKHIGIYAYTRDALKVIDSLSSCHLEDAEKLEQLRFLYYGLRIKVNETKYEALGIDTVEDLKTAENYARTSLT